jgi:GNAT superfamily N-acetyltransferase
VTPAGYRPGTIAEIVRLHVDYYAREWDFGLAFEARVARELSDFLGGFRDGVDHFATHWNQAGELDGTVSLEGPTVEEPVGHLRWFIVSDRARGSGLGRRLLAGAIAHADRSGFAGIYLTTFDGLGPARHLYESCGFRLTAESPDDRWAGGVREQRFERTMPS